MKDLQDHVCYIYLLLAGLTQCSEAGLSLRDSTAPESYGLIIAGGFLLSAFLCPALLTGSVTAVTSKGGIL